MQPIRYGMVGGGQGAFIGAVHRAAARLTGEYTLVCGALSSDPDRARTSALELGLPPARGYSDFRSMFAAEAQRSASERIQCVVIVTPNHSHLEIAEAALAAGFHVISDKPATTTLAECQQLAAALKRSGLHYMLTHPYSGYPMIREARERIARGDLGRIRKVLVEYTQGWLAAPLEAQGQKQASWRLDPAQSGASCCMGDIGVHAFQLSEFVTGLAVRELAASLNSVVSGRKLDDDGTVLLRYEEGVSGVLMASQICVGDENNLRLRVYGDRASIDWQQMEPNSLWLKSADAPAQLLRTGSFGVGAAATAATRLPAGHPEGFYEAFANLYAEFATLLRTPVGTSSTTLPGIRDALRGMAFVETAVASSATGSCWMPLTI